MAGRRGKHNNAASRALQLAIVTTPIASDDRSGTGPTQPLFYCGAASLAGP
ncbi:hypothetical protein R69746_06245 [Paraburkholderia aspalathi]|nr:hypothetical protein R75465_03838 [Paraburkholderia aspalathi]CAE6825274.1 hypothetical protein R69746_06245 [Paraburkholderia aspalathi]